MESLYRVSSSPRKAAPGEAESVVSDLNDHHRIAPRFKGLEDPPLLIVVDIT
jgi:hypothetical protein